MTERELDALVAVVAWFSDESEEDFEAERTNGESTENHIFRDIQILDKFLLGKALDWQVIHKSEMARVRAALGGQP